MTVDQGLGCLSGPECGQGPSSAFLDYRMASKDAVLLGGLLWSPMGFRGGPSQHGPGNGWPETVHEVSTLPDGPEGDEHLVCLRGQVALALGRWLPTLGLPGRSHVAFGLKPFLKPVEDYCSGPPSPSLRLDVLSCPHSDHVDQMCSQALEVGPPGSALPDCFKTL